MEIRSEPDEDHIAKYVRYTATRDGLETVVKVSQALVDDPDFPLDQFLQEEFEERLGVLEEARRERDVS